MWVNMIGFCVWKLLQNRKSQCRCILVVHVYLSKLCFRSHFTNFYRIFMKFLNQSDQTHISNLPFFVQIQKCIVISIYQTGRFFSTPFSFYVQYSLLSTIIAENPSFCWGSLKKLVWNFSFRSGPPTPLMEKGEGQIKISIVKLWNLP